MRSTEPSLLANVQTIAVVEGLEKVAVHSRFAHGTLGLGKIVVFRDLEGQEGLVLERSVEDW